MSAVDEMYRTDGIVPVTPQAVAELCAEIQRLDAKILGWKLTALAMRDEAIFWEQDGTPRCSEIERMYFDAAMGDQFVSPKRGQIGYVEIGHG